MKDESRKTLILTDGELLLLAAACGVRRMFGFADIELQPRGWELNAVGSLTDAGLMEWRDGALAPAPDAERLFSCVIHAGQLFSLVPGSDKLPQLCLFPWAGRVTVLDPYPFRPGCSRLGQFSTDEVGEELTEFGYLPSAADGSQPVPVAPPQPDPLLLRSMTDLDADATEKTGEPGVMAILDRFSPADSSRTGRCAVIDAGIAFVTLFIDRSGACRAEPYNRNHLLDWMEVSV